MTCNSVVVGLAINRTNAWHFNLYTGCKLEIGIRHSCAVCSKHYHITTSCSREENHMERTQTIFFHWWHNWNVISRTHFVGATCEWKLAGGLMRRTPNNIALINIHELGISPVQAEFARGTTGISHMYFNGASSKSMAYHNFISLDDQENNRVCKG